MNDGYVSTQIRSIQTLGSVAIIASPISLVFGGFLLSLVAVICAAVGRSKLKMLSATDDVDPGIIHALDRQNKVGLVISIVTLVVNTIFFIVMFNTLMQVAQTGDVSLLTQALGIDPASVGADGADENVSIWDR